MKHELNTQTRPGLMASLGVTSNYMKTIELREFYKTLSELNNSFTHYSFVWHQFDIDYSSTLEQNPDTLTKDYFQSNPYRRKHNIKFSELEKEHSKTYESLVQGIFLLIYTHFEGYLKNILVFANSVNDKIEPLESKLDDTESDFMLIDKVFNRIGINKDALQTEILCTIDYIRLKRNRLIHSNSKSISNSLNNLIIKQGSALNDFWNENLPSNLQGIDFKSKTNANELAFSLIIDVINIFRRISSDFDQIVIEKLTKNAITKQIVIPKFKEIQGKKITGISLERIISKFTKFCQSEFGMSIDSQQIDLLKSSIV